MNLPVASLAAAVLGAAVAAAVFGMPAPMLEALVMDSGIPAILTAAEPPLGMTARLAIAGGAGGAVALIVWFALFLLFGTRGISVARETASPRAVPVIRRADAHPDARPRAPLLATRDLGTPFLEVTADRGEVHEDQTRLFAPVHVVAPEAEPVLPVPPLEAVAPVVDEAPAAPVEPVERPLPANLDQPLSAFDPDAILQSPMPPPVTLPPLRRAPRPAVFDAGERFETFELTPIRRTPAPRPVPAPVVRDEAIARPETDATIHALLDRLERGVVKRGLGHVEPQTPREAERGLEEALVTLRNLARRA
jgi:hypothetical protein